MSAATTGAGVAQVQPRLMRKNSREQLRLSVDEYRGKLLISCRIWYAPTGAMPLDQLSAIIAGLQQLEAEARAAGLLP
jgi:hypothetical protein